MARPVGSIEVRWDSSQQAPGSNGSTTDVDATRLGHDLPHRLRRPTRRHSRLRLLGRSLYLRLRSEAKLRSYLQPPMSMLRASPGLRGRGVAAACRRRWAILSARRPDTAMGETARSSCPTYSVVGAGVSDWREQPDVLCSLRRALRVLEHLLALRWRRSKETLQPELRQGVCVELRGS
jgi:hypothetical protein